MKKQFLHWVCAILLIAVGCSDETFVDDQVTDDKPTMITLTAGMPDELNAGMPDEGVQTKIGMRREKLDNKLKWETNDQLQLCLKYGNTFSKQVTTVANISADGKTATFQVTLPEGNYETFDLYGVYGGGGLDNTDPYKAILPSSAASMSGSLDTLKARKTVMLFFAKTGISRANPNFSVNLEHMGSLFCIQLRNMSSASWNNIKKVQLSATSTIYAHNNAGSAYYDLTNRTFSGTTSGNTLTFELPSATNLAVGGLLEFWGWYPPAAGQNWPAMTLKVIDGSGTQLAQSASSKPARTEATPAGKVFYFPAIYDGTNFDFTTTAPPPIKDIDGNMYKTVVIGDLEWMAENLKVTHYRNGNPIPTGYSGAEWVALTSGAYAVYPYGQTSGKVSSEAEMIAKYGLLYNGYAVVAQEGLAPEGWRVATDEDYKKLERFAGMSENEIAREGPSASNRGSVDSIAYKLRSKDWQATPPSTDEFGFNALPAGYRQGYSPGNFMEFNTFQGNNLAVNTLNTAGNNIYRRSIRYYPIYKDLVTMRIGMSVRCVRDMH